MSCCFKVQKFLFFFKFTSLFLKLELGDKLNLKDCIYFDLNFLRFSMKFKLCSHSQILYFKSCYVYLLIYFCQ